MMGGKKGTNNELDLPSSPKITIAPSVVNEVNVVGVCGPFIRLHKFDTCELFKIPHG